MDATDLQILKILQQDGRITMKALAQQIAMSVPAAAERVRRMEERGVIAGYAAQIEPAALGREVDAVILATARPGCDARLRTLIQDCPDVTEAWDVAGRVGLLLRVNCADMPAFQALVKTLQGLSDTESYFYLHQLKKAGVPITPDQ